MNNKIKTFLLGFFTTIILILAGFALIKSQTKLEAQQSCYNLTTFDYVINSPSNDQINELANSKEEVNSIFPCYSFKTTLNGNSSSKISLLLSDQMDNYETGFFNKKTKLNGKFDVNGICLDKTAADKLNVKVGDNVSVSLAYQTFIFKVTSIYMSVSYMSFDDGVALASFKDEIKNAYQRELTYDCAFIDANNLNACSVLLQNYIPLGPLMNEQDYIDNFKSQNNCPPAMTQEEWENSIKTSYAEYKANYLNQEFKDSVQLKDSFHSSLVVRLQSKYTTIKVFAIIASICICVLYSILFILIINSNLENDKILAKDGKKDIDKEYIKMNCVVSLLTFIIVCITLFILSLISAFFKETYFIVLAISCPILVASLFVRIFINKYISTVYK